MVKYNWNWAVLFQDPYVGWIFSGLVYTIVIALLGALIALVVGSLVGIFRTVDNKTLQSIASGYVELFRNIPLLVQLFIWYYVVPEVVPTPVGNWIKHDLPYPEVTTATVCLGLYTASRVAEQVRSGLEAISQGQRNAAKAMGLTTAQAYRYILVPVAFRTIIPSLTSELIGIFKNTSLALTIGVLELTAQVRQIDEYTFASFEAFAAATVLYCLIAFVVIAVMRNVERRVFIPGAVTSGGR